MTGGIYTKLAKTAAEQFIREQSRMELPPTLPTPLLQQKACYISIYENPGRHFRSMFGQPFPRHGVLAEEIITNTIEAIVRSHSQAFRRSDLSYLIYTVAVLDPLERIQGPEHLQPETHGLYIRSDRGKTALILPRRLGIESGEDQVATAMRESGIETRHEAVTLYRFRVTYYE